MGGISAGLHTYIYIWKLRVEIVLTNTYKQQASSQDTRTRQDESPCLLDGHIWQANRNGQL
jgi:hypothetical protein